MVHDPHVETNAAQLIVGKGESETCWVENHDENMMFFSLKPICSYSESWALGMSEYSPSTCLTNVPYHRNVVRRGGWDCNSCGVCETIYGYTRSTLLWRPWCNVSLWWDPWSENDHCVWYPRHRRRSDLCRVFINSCLFPFFHDAGTSFGTGVCSHACNETYGDMIHARGAWQRNAGESHQNLYVSPHNGLSKSIRVSEWENNEQREQRVLCSV